jgi:hypothetical protein
MTISEVRDILGADLLTGQENLRTNLRTQFSLYADIAAIIIINGREPAAETVAKADEENLAILVSSLPAFELSGRLYAMGLPGSRGSTIPPGLALDALELSPGHAPEARSGFGRHGLPLLCGSDAHFLADIGQAHTTFTVQSPTFSEIAMALRGEAGRCVRI